MPAVSGACQNRSLRDRSPWREVQANEPPEDILLWASLLSHVHVAEKQERAAPGRYGEDFRPCFCALHQAGYDHRISIECTWQNLATEVSPAIETIREQWRAMDAPD